MDENKTSNLLVSFFPSLISLFVSFLSPKDWSIHPQWTFFSKYEHMILHLHVVVVEIPSKTSQEVCAGGQLA